MNGGWVWSDVVGGKDRTARFRSMLAALAKANSAYLYVVSSYVHDRERDIHPERDAVMFSCGSTGLNAVLHNNFPVGVLRTIDKATNFDAVADRLRAVNGYHWVDMYVGVHLTKGDVDLNELYRKLLSHFHEWVVEVPKP